MLWDYVGMSRSDASLRKALTQVPQLRQEFWERVVVPGGASNQNQNLEYAGRVADYLEFAEVLTLDALHRAESCGGHFRVRVADPGRGGPAGRRALQLRRRLGVRGAGGAPRLHREPLDFQDVHPTQRSYK